MNTSGLPYFCYATHGGKTVLVKYKHKGFIDSSLQSPADELNEKIDVTKAQAAAMKAGAMLGWNIPSSDPSNYNEDGSMKLCK